MEHRVERGVPKGERDPSVPGQQRVVIEAGELRWPDDVVVGERQEEADEHRARREDDEADDPGQQEEERPAGLGGHAAPPPRDGGGACSGHGSISSSLQRGHCAESIACWAS